MYIEKRATNVKEAQKVNVQQPWVKIDEEFSQRDIAVKLVKKQLKKRKNCVRLLR